MLRGALPETMRARSAEGPRNEFDREAAGYDATAVSTMPRYGELHQMLLWGVPYLATRAFTVLELGCGTGTLTERLLGEFPHAQVTAVDLSPRMIELARRKTYRFRRRVTFRVEQLTDLDLEGPYDAVVSALAIHHLADRAKGTLFRRVARWLPPGGYFGNADDHLPEDPVFDSRFRQIASALQASGAPPPGGSSPQAVWHAHEAFDHPASLSAEIELLRRAGLTHVDVPWRFFDQAVIWAYR
jgi:tRNA (cmo5U34)-methyltransferase